MIYIEIITVIVIIFNLFFSSFQIRVPADNPAAGEDMCYFEKKNQGELYQLLKPKSQ